MRPIATPRLTGGCVLLVAAACGGAPPPQPVLPAPGATPSAAAAVSAASHCPPYAPAVVSGCPTKPDPEPELAGSLDPVRDRVFGRQRETLNAARSFSRPTTESDGSLDQAERCGQLASTTDRHRIGPLRDGAPVVVFSGTIPSDTADPTTWYTVVARDGCTWRSVFDDDEMFEPSLYRAPDGSRILVTHSLSDQCTQNESARVLRGGATEPLWSGSQIRPDMAGSVCPDVSRVEWVTQGDLLLGVDVSSRDIDGDTPRGAWRKQSLRWRGGRLVPEPSPPAH